MPNISKIADPRSWAKWIASGAVRQSRKSSRTAVYDAAYFLRHPHRVTRRGTIDPWGSIRILGMGAGAWADDRTLDAFDVLQPGLPIWSAKLTGLPSASCASVEGGHVIVHRNGRVTAKIAPRDCRIVDVGECVVDASGHLQHMILVKEGGINKRLEQAFFQAERGEMPCYLDNGMFVQVSKKLAGQKVVMLDFGLHEGAVVFTKDGRQIPCTCHELLAYKKWGVQMDDIPS